MYFIDIKLDLSHVYINYLEIFHSFLFFQNLKLLYKFLLFKNKCNLQNGNIVIYKALCFDVAQGRLNGASNETRTHSCRFASQAR